MDISLAQQTWELKGFWPWVPVKGVSMEVGEELMGVTEWLPATVPGGVHRDLYLAGLIEHPYVDLNSLHGEWVENRWWVYRASFPLPPAPGRGKRMELVFKGLDYEALIYWDGKLLGEHKGMFHPAVFDVTALAAGAEAAELKVVFKQAPDEMAQIGKTSETFTQKSRFNYKWDFSTRLVNIGIWDDVVLRVLDEYSLDDLHLRTDAEDGVGRIELSGAMRAHSPGGHGAGARLTVTVLDPEGREAARHSRDVAGERWSVEMAVDRPQLWYPNGYGSQPLYEVVAELAAADGRTLDERRFRTGIRRLEFRRNEGSPASSLPYTFVVNGKRIYIKGANLTPLDHLYGNVGQERYEWIVRLAKSAHLNMLRIWGGGLIEKPYLYELCDRNGILLWQEFIQSSSGIDNIPSKRPEFLALLKMTAVAALKDRRNHVSLAVWSGGNELMSAPNQPSTFEDANVAMLKELTERFDPDRLFLPTSASGPVEFITERKGVSHDVHGHWKYQGHPEHYELYAQSDSLFHSEFGVDGLSSLKTLARYIGPGHLRPTDMRRDPVWRHHGEWWDTYDRDVALFGEPRDLETFIDCSQWMQAEGLRYILEANRRRKFANSGSIVWQLNEPWPNVSCTNLVDYEMELKMAYYWVKRAFEPDHVSLDYRKLDYRPGERFAAPIYVHRSEGPAAYDVRAELLDETGRIRGEWTFAGRTDADRPVCAGTLSFDVPGGWQGLLFVRLRLEIEGAMNGASTNVYYFSPQAGIVYEPALRLAGAALDVRPLGPWTTAEPNGEGAATRERSYRVANVDRKAALHVYAQEGTGRHWIAADRSYETLFPGEEMIVKVVSAKRAEAVFPQASDGRERPAPEPEIEFYAFGSRKPGSAELERSYAESGGAR